MKNNRKIMSQAYGINNLAKRMRIKVNINPIILLLTLFTFNLINFSFASQQDINFQHLTIEDGLSQNTSFCILQDRKGLMWFGTEDGLNRYNGYKFKVYKNDLKDPYSISSNYVLTMFEDQQGILWIGTDGGGLNQYDSNKENFIRYMNIPDNPNSLSHNRVNTICADSSGNIWIGTNGGGLDKFDPRTKQFTHFKHDPENLNSLSSDNVYSVIWDKSGFLWIGTDNGLNKFDTANESFIQYYADPANPSSLSFNYILNLFLDRAGILWIGTSGGGLNKLKLSDNTGSSPVFISYKNDYKSPASISGDVVTTIFEDKTGVLWIGTDGNGLNKLNASYEESNAAFDHYISDPSDLNSIINSRIVSIYQDRSGVLWIGTKGGGISKYDREKKNFVLIRNKPNDTNSISHNAVRVLNEDKAGNLWIGTDGGGLDRLNQKTGLYTHYKNNPRNPNSLSYNFVRSIHQDRTGYLWIGTDGGGINKLNPKTGKFIRYEHDPNDPYSLGHNTIRPIFEDSNGLLWIGTYGAGLDLFDRKKNRFIHFINDPSDSNSISHNYIYCIYEDRSGVLWIGTDGGGLNQYNRDKKMFHRFQHNPDNPNSISQNNIYCLYEDKSGILWLGTRGGGLNKFDPETQNFIHYTEKHGMPNSTVYGILGDDNGNIWISTNRGLSKFDPVSEKFKNYDINDGLQSNEFNGGSYIRSNSGEMYFGGINGMNRFFPNEIKDNPNIPPVVITNFQIFNKPVPIGTELDDRLILEKSIIETQELEISYKDRVFSFEFAALNYVAPEKNQYAYMMENFENEWNYIGERKFVSYTNLPPGDYIFRVKASNCDGVWNEKGTSIKLTITPPYWETAWFRILVLMILLSLVYLVYNIRVRSIQERSRELEENVKKRTKQATLLNEVGQRLSSELELDSLLSEIVNTICESFNYYGVMLLLPDWDEDVLTIRSAAGDFKDVISGDISVKIGEGMIGTAAVSKEIQISGDVSKDPTFIMQSEEKTKSELSVPILSGEELIGVLDIQSDRLNAFEKSDIAALKTLSTHISSAIDNARLYDQAQQEISERKRIENEIQHRATQATLLYETGQKLSSKLNLDSLLDEIVTIVCQTFNFYGVMLLLPDKTGKALILRSIAGGYKNVFSKDLTLKFGEGMIGKAASTQKIQISADVTKDSNYVKKAEEVTLSELSVPIKSEGKVIGVLDIQSDRKNAFNETDVEAMEILSSQIASTIENARLYDQAQQEIIERKKAEDDLRRAKRETDDILQNVKEGLFLLDHEYKIESQYSAALENILLEKKLANKSFTKYLEQKIDEKMISDIEDYLSILFDKEIDEDTLSQLNPLSQIEANFNGDGSKFLTFDFRRIKEEDRTVRIIATVNDITEKIHLEQDLEETRVENKRKMDWLLCILNVEPVMLQEFIKSAGSEIDNVDNVLEGLEQNKKTVELLDIVYRSIHTIKGNASLLELDFFAERAHQVEDKIAELKEKKQITRNDINELQNQTKMIHSVYNEVKELLDQIGQLHDQFRPKRSHEHNLLVRSLIKLADNLGKEYNKNIKLITDNFKGDNIPYKHRLLIRDILVQLIRNSMFHGIEIEAEREEKGKQKIGIIEIECNNSNGDFVLKFKDDGRGLMLDKLLEKAKGLRKWSSDEINKWEIKELTEVIFIPGVTTSEQADLTAGRGMGMDIIKNKIDNIGGKISIETEEGLFTQFDIILPVS